MLHNEIRLQFAVSERMHGVTEVWGIHSCRIKTEQQQLSNTDRALVLASMLSLMRYIAAAL